MAINTDRPCILSGEIIVGGHNMVSNLVFRRIVLAIPAFKDMVRDPACSLYGIFVSVFFFYTDATMHFYVLSFFLVHNLVFF